MDEVHEVGAEAQVVVRCVVPDEDVDEVRRSIRAPTTCVPARTPDTASGKRRRALDSSFVPACAICGSVLLPSGGKVRRGRGGIVCVVV